MWTVYSALRLFKEIYLKSYLPRNRNRTPNLKSESLDYQATLMDALSGIMITIHFIS